MGPVCWLELEHHEGVGDSDICYVIREHGRNNVSTESFHYHELSLLFKSRPPAQYPALSEALPKTSLVRKAIDEERLRDESKAQQ